MFQFHRHDSIEVAQIRQLEGDTRIRSVVYT